MEHNEKTTLLGKAKQVGEHLAEAGDKAACFKTAAAHAVEDAVTEAKRFAKHSRYAAEDFVDDTSHRIKHNPLRSIALSAAIGLGTGALAVWLATHRE